jgi:ubiquinone/menaquinone biosynthesis C-methylase UbiE
VQFIQADASEIPTDRPFDAVAGRFILMFLPDPASVLSSLIRMLKPGGIIAFQEPSWSPFLAFNRRYPLCSELLHAIHETFVRSEVNPEMGPDLYRIFQEIGLPAPSMHMEAAMGCDAEFVSIFSGVIGSLRPLAREHNVSLDGLGDVETLPQRIHDEVAAVKGVISLIPLVGVWARKPSDNGV